MRVALVAPLASGTQREFLSHKASRLDEILTFPVSTGELLPMLTRPAHFGGNPKVGVSDRTGLLLIPQPGRVRRIKREAVRENILKALSGHRVRLPTQPGGVPTWRFSEGSRGGVTSLSPSYSGSFSSSPPKKTHSVGDVRSGVICREFMKPYYDNCSWSHVKIFLHGVML